MAAEAVLDAWAAIALLGGEEPAAGRVEATLAERRTVMNWVNLCEVAYMVERRHGPEAAQGAVRDLRARLAATVEIGRELAHGAARLKVPGGLSLADAFAAATAQLHGAVLLTGDPELLGDGGSFRTEDLRA